MGKLLVKDFLLAIKGLKSAIVTGSNKSAREILAVMQLERTFSCVDRRVYEFKATRAWRVKNRVDHVFCKAVNVPTLFHQSCGVLRTHTLFFIGRAGR